MHPRGPGTTSRILIVDDNPDLLANLVEILGDSGFEVAGAASLEAARVQVRRESPDVALVDVNLPDGSGLQLVEEFQQACARTVCFAFSGVDSHDVRTKALRSGARAFFGKSDGLEKVLQAVELAADEARGSGP